MKYPHLLELAAALALTSTVDAPARRPGLPRRPGKPARRRALARRRRLRLAKLARKRSRGSRRKR